MNGEQEANGKMMDAEAESGSFSSARDGDAGGDGFVKPDFAAFPMTDSADAAEEIDAMAVETNYDVSAEDAPLNDGEAESVADAAVETESFDGKGERDASSYTVDHTENDGNGDFTRNDEPYYHGSAYGNGAYGGYGRGYGAPNGQTRGNYRENSSYGYRGEKDGPQNKKVFWLIPVSVLLCVVLSLGSFGLAWTLSKAMYENGNGGYQNGGGSSDGGGTGSTGTEEKSPFLGNGEIVIEQLPSDSIYYTIPSVVSQTQDSVVEITTERMNTGSYYGQYVTKGAGSGVIIMSYSENGTSGACGTYIITNDHVISGAFSAKVKLTNGTEYDAAIVGTDPQTDIAVLHINEVNLPTASFGVSADLQAGETVVVIGNPLGSLGGSVSSGIISCTERNIEIGDNVMKLIQTTAAVNPGNSGGAMFDLEGKLVGVVNAKYSDEQIEGIGFAIPSDIARAVASDLMNYGYVKGRPNHGMEFQYGYCEYEYGFNSKVTVNYDGKEVQGVWVSELASGSDAKKAGIKALDQIVSVVGADAKTYTFASVDQANAFFDGLKIGDVITVSVYRYTPRSSGYGIFFDRTEKTFTLTVTEYVA